MLMWQLELLQSVRLRSSWVQSTCLTQFEEDRNAQRLSKYILTYVVNLHTCPPVNLRNHAGRLLINLQSICSFK